MYQKNECEALLDKLLPFAEIEDHFILKPAAGDGEGFDIGLGDGHAGQAHFLHLGRRAAGFQNGQPLILGQGLIAVDDMKIVTHADDEIFTLILPE